jgi:alkaline phosphatase
VDADGKPYTILAFGNGPNRVTDRAAMTTLTDATVGANYYQQETAIKLSSETHGGTDVFLGAIGMNSQLFTGTIDNTEVYKLVLKAFGL